MSAFNYADWWWVSEQLSRFTYRPNWTMTLDDLMVPWAEPFPQAIIIRLVFYAPDSRNEVVDQNLRQFNVDTGQSEPVRVRKDVKIGAVKQVPLYILDERSADNFARWLARSIEDMELHESREWLRRDGELWNDPHAPVGRT